MNTLQIRHNTKLNMDLPRIFGIFIFLVTWFTKGKQSYNGKHLGQGRQRIRSEGSEAENINSQEASKFYITKFMNTNQGGMIISQIFVLKAERPSSKSGADPKYFHLFYSQYTFTARVLLSIYNYKLANLYKSKVYFDNTWQSLNCTSNSSNR